MRGKIAAVAASYQHATFWQLRVIATASLQPRVLSTTVQPGSPMPSNYLQGITWQLRARPLVAFVLLSILVLLLSIGALIVSRRFVGALTHELPRDTMFLTALGATAVLAWLRIAWRRNFPLGFPLDNSAKYSNPPESLNDSSPGSTIGISHLDQAIGWGSCLALALLALGCCYPANRNSDWLIWLPLLVADQLWRQNFFDAGTPTAQPFKSPAKPSASAPANPTGLAEVGPSSDVSHNIVQQLFRVLEDQGQEVVYGTLRADFDAGQRTAVIHVGFCPPLGYLPEIEAESLPDQPTRIKVVQALSHGVRLDVRRTAPFDQQSCVWIDMAARPILPTKQRQISA